MPKEKQEGGDDLLFALAPIRDLVGLVIVRCLQIIDKNMQYTS